MKYLFLLLVLFSLPAVGQDTLSHDELQAGVTMLATLRMLVDFADDYAKECYDDSTIAYREEGGLRHICLVYGCQQVWDIPPHEVFDHWTHREPTFTGFIDYLRRRLTP